MAKDRVRISRIAFVLVISQLHQVNILFEKNQCLDICTPTVFSTALNRILISTRFHGQVFYWSQWLILVVFVFSLVYTAIKSFVKASGRRQDGEVSPLLENDAVPEDDEEDQLTDEW